VFGTTVIQVLLENSHVWNAADPAENSPILVVCYTNHALDQFLEGLSAFVRRGIVRVGGAAGARSWRRSCCGSCAGEAATRAPYRAASSSTASRREATWNCSRLSTVTSGVAVGWAEWGGQSPRGPEYRGL